MNTRPLIDQVRYRTLASAELRRGFLIDDLFAADEMRLTYCAADRLIAGSAVPVERSLRLEPDRELAASFFCERREVGILNIGDAGSVTVDGRRFELVNRDCLYVGRGSRDVVFASADGAQPARFYLLSCPAHADHPAAHVSADGATTETLGMTVAANRRTIHKYIHRDGIQSCQLVMGFTTLAPGSVWNTMPPHRHPRRTEVYLYFDLGHDGMVFHFMGEPDDTRHLVVRDGQAILSPGWSIHSGVGNCAYSFCWGMAGENQEFTDMEPVAPGDLA